MFLLISIPFNKIHSKFNIDTVFRELNQRFNLIAYCVCDTEIEARDLAIYLASTLLSKFNSPE